MTRTILLTIMLLLGCGVDSEVRATAIRAGLTENAVSRCFTCAGACVSARQKLIDRHGVNPNDVSCETPRIVGAGRQVEACRGALWDELGVALVP
ncbi:MAG: hypothetical protein SFW67_02425 [Myxococcaceae bacterium]|nr:hypothetical protein [Myxococcaceae bacterium]